MVKPSRIRGYKMPNLGLFNDIAASSQTVNAVLFVDVVAPPSGISFITTWDTTKDGSIPTQIVIPTISTGTYDCVVDWGDSTSDAINTWDDAKWTHTYASQGTYTVTITGQFEGFSFANSGDKLKLLDISQWGEDFKLGTNEGSYFFGCANLDISATDSLNCEGLTSLATAFANCSSFNASLDFLDLTNVNSIQAMLTGCSSFNKSINNLNYANILTLSNLLRNCTAFNQVVNITAPSINSCDAMFDGCTSMASTITINGAVIESASTMIKNCSLLTVQPTLDISQGKYLSGMFQGTSFSTITLPSNMYDVRECTSMFDNCTSLTNIINLNKFNLSLVTSIGGFCSDSKLDTDNYSDALIFWATLTLKDNVTIDMGTSKYNAEGAVAKQYIIDTFDWTFIDGGQATVKNPNVTAGGTLQIDTAQFASGTSSALFDGGGYITVPAHDQLFYFGTSDFEIEFDVRFASNGIYGLLTRYSGLSAYTNIWCYVTGTTASYFSYDEVYYGYTNPISVPATNITLSVDTWYHFKLSRVDTNWYIHLDEVKVGEVLGVVYDISEWSNIILGGFRNTGPLVYMLNGWIDNVKITVDGVLNLWLEMEGTDGSTTITDSALNE